MIEDPVWARACMGGGGACGVERPSMQARTHTPHALINTTNDTTNVRRAVLGPHVSPLPVFRGRIVPIPQHRQQLVVGDCVSVVVVFV